MGGSAARAGVMPTARYQHGAVFVNARLHISGGAVGGGRMVDDAAPVVVLDTAAGVWCTQAPAAAGAADAADSHEWARRCARGFTNFRGAPRRHGDRQPQRGRGAGAGTRWRRWGRTYLCTAACAAARC